MIFQISFSIIEQLTKQYGIDVWSRFLEILYAPKTNTDMIWILIPLILTILLLEFYFGRYVEEELGWNTAFANSLVLIFVSIDLARHLYYSNLLFTINTKLILAFIILIEGLSLAFIDFFHVLPKRIAFKLSSTLPINFIAFCCIILVYTDINIDFITISAFLLFLFFLVVIIGFIHIIEPKVRTMFTPPMPPTL